MTSIASSIEGPTNFSAQSAHSPSSTRLPSIRISLQSADSAPCATISCKATDLPPPGSPPMSMLRSARLTLTCWPVSSVPRWIGFQIDRERDGDRGRGAHGVLFTCLRAT